MPKRNDPKSQSEAEGDKEYSIGFHEQDYMSEAPSTMRTTVSTVYEDNMGFGMTEGDDFDSDNRSDTGFSQTSYASSSGSAMVGKSSSKLGAPPPPNKYDGEPFKCPYCFQIVSGIENPSSWQ
jgi:hypothetical protein